MDYHLPHNHVAVRDGLPSALRPTLLEEAQGEWSKHPRFAGKARFFMNIHRQLLDGAKGMATTLEKLLDLPAQDAKTELQKSGLINRGRYLIQFAHGHHEIEDHGYFPQFIRLEPGLKRALDLMDRDHKVLDEALNGSERAMIALVQKGVTTDNLAAFYHHARALDKVMHRHITDEEDVIIPIFLRHG